MVYRKVVKVLVGAGWIEVRSCGSHHTFKHPGNNSVVTIPDHGNKDISIGVLKSVEKITGLSFNR